MSSTRSSASAAWTRPAKRFVAAYDHEHPDASLASAADSRFLAAE